MNQTFASIAVAMMVPAVAVIYVVILERRHVPEKRITPEIELMIPTLTNSPVPVVTPRRWRWS
jgi:hypothetical protein